MIFTDAEREYLQVQTLGRLATVQSDGSPQVNPVGFTYNDELESIDISGFRMGSSQKYRNVRGNPRVAFVVDDIPSTQPYQARFLEIRGAAEAVGEGNGAIIRITPERIIGFGVEKLGEPHELLPNSRNVARVA